MSENKYAKFNTPLVSKDFWAGMYLALDDWNDKLGTYDRSHIDNSSGMPSTIGTVLHVLDTMGIIPEWDLGLLFESFPYGYDKDIDAILKVWEDLPR